MKKLLALLLVFVFALSLVACGSKDGGSGLVGTWECVDDDVVVVFNANGTMSVEEGGQSGEGTYSYDEESDTLTFNLGDEERETELKLDGDKMEVFGQEYKKAK